MRVVFFIMLFVVTTIEISKNTLKRIRRHWIKHACTKLSGGFAQCILRYGSFDINFPTSYLKEEALKSWKAFVNLRKSLESLINYFEAPKSGKTTTITATKIDKWIMKRSIIDISIGYIKIHSPQHSAPKGNMKFEILLAKILV